MIFDNQVYEIDIEALLDSKNLDLNELLLTENDELSLKQTSALVDRVKNIIETLPPREADFVELYYFKHLKQTDISNIFQVSQPTVCYRLQRATSRIQFLLNLPDISVDAMKVELGKHLKDSLDISILIEMYKTTCQSEVAKILNVSQGLVRHRFIRSLKRLDKNPDASDLFKIFKAISNNLNVLREVQKTANEPKMSYVLF
jgi:DNA-directed RNA polymerase specialized sigma24 family protein